LLEQLSDYQLLKKELVPWNYLYIWTEASKAFATGFHYLSRGMRGMCFWGPLSTVPCTKEKQTFLRIQTTVFAYLVPCTLLRTPTEKKGETQSTLLCMLYMYNNNSASLCATKVDSCEYGNEPSGSRKARGIS